MIIAICDPAIFASLQYFFEFNPYYSASQASVGCVLARTAPANHTAPKVREITHPTPRSLAPGRGETTNGATRLALQRGRASPGLSNNTARGRRNPRRPERDVPNTAAATRPARPAPRGSAATAPMEGRGKTGS